MSGIINLGTVCVPLDPHKMHVNGVVLGGLPGQPTALLWPRLQC